MNLELKRLNSKEGYQKLDESSTEDDSEIIVVSESDIEKNKEEEEDRLRRLNIKQLSSKEIIIKSTKISLKNWRKSVYNQVELFFTQIFSMYLPILKAKIIDAISSNRNYEELFSRFKTYFFFYFYN